MIPFGAKCSVVPATTITCFPGPPSPNLSWLQGQHSPRLSRWNHRRAKDRSTPLPGRKRSSRILPFPQSLSPGDKNAVLGIPVAPKYLNICSLQTWPQALVDSSLGLQIIPTWGLSGLEAMWIFSGAANSVTSDYTTSFSQTLKGASSWYILDAQCLQSWYFSWLSNPLP